jgi:hypothetical protein
MNDRPQLDRATIEQAFRLMGQYLLDRKAFGEIAVYGGRVMLLQFEWRRLSEDVDARIISSNHGLVMAAVQEAARRLGLPASWLSESVAMYARRGEGEPDRVLVGTYPYPERVGLRVTAAKPAYILAMKLRALQRTTVDDRDFADAISLGVECGARTPERLRDIYRSFFPDEELPTEAELRLNELARAIEAKPR